MTIQFVKRIIDDAEVQAAQLSHESVRELAAWCNGMEVEEIAWDDSKHPGINVPTTFGNKRASEGDFIVLSPGERFAIFTEDEFKSQFTVT